MATNYLTLVEKDIIAQLYSVKLRVGAGRATLPNWAKVLYVGSFLSQPTIKTYMAPIAQIETVQFQIQIGVRDARNSNWEIYDVITDVRQALTGRRIDNLMTGLYESASTFLGLEEGYWRHDVFYTFTVPRQFDQVQVQPS